MIRTLRTALLCAALSLSATPALALEAPELATEAAQYASQVQAVDSGSNLSDLFLIRRAERYAQQEQWPEAIADVETLIGRGNDSTAWWYRLALMWRDGPADTAKARQAAYNAYRLGDTDSAKSRALFLLGDLDVDEEPRRALEAWREALGLTEDSVYLERFKTLESRLAFQVEGVETDAESERPRVCALFSDDLANPRSVDFAQYLQLSPAIDGAVSARDNRLCIDGAAHGSQYEVTVRAGVPSASGHTTRSPYTATVAMPDREPSVGFRGMAYVLPKGGQHSVPLTTVNVDAVALELLRFNDRSLNTVLLNGRMDRNIDGWQADNIAEEQGERLWQGRMDLANQPNAEVTTAIPVDALIPALKPGIYAITAQDERTLEETYRDRATQWLIVSDLGLITHQGSDGLHVFVRSLADGSARSDVELALVARNNAELARQRSDEQGHVLFSPGLMRASGGNTPLALMAYADDGDYGLLDLTGPALDLSDRGVSGREAPGPVDAFLYTERGVYRPGETVHLMTLVRDASARAITGLPLTLTLTRPDEVEAERLTLQADASGGYHSAVDLPNNARTGTWSARVYLDPDAPAVGEVQFQVEYFVPQTIRVELAADREALKPGDTTAVTVTGEFLYGAAAADLPTEAEVVLREAAEPFPDWPGYRFGLEQDSYTANRIEVDSEALDGQGHTTLSVSVDEIPDTSKPLEAMIRVGVFEPGGRAVNKIVTLPYRHQPLSIGIKPAFSGDAVAEGQPARFEVIALDADGRPLDRAGLKYELVREEYDYYWYYRDGRWDYQTLVQDGEPVVAGELAGGAEPRRIESRPLAWGYYRLEVFDPDSGIASSVRFRTGWFVAPGGSDTPDRLQVSLDKSGYAPGETARVFIKAPFAGEVLLTVASDKVWHYRALTQPGEDGVTVDIPVEADWSPGVYLTATALRPGSQARDVGPNRAIGVAWMPLDAAARTLEVAVDAPEAVTPRQTLTVPVTVSGGDGPVNLTLAAVDEGVLQLTDFKTPDPRSHYLGKRRLGVDLRDLYGRLITPAGELGRLRSGGDADVSNLSGSDVRPTKTVALFSGVVAVRDGRAEIPLELPDFNGELRLMAVAWDADRVGRGEQAMKVRDPVLARAYLPRFLAPGDVAAMTLVVQDLGAAAGEYTVSVGATTPLALVDGDFSTGFSAGGAAINRRLLLGADGLGAGRVTIRIDGPQGYRLERDYDLEVRAPNAIVSRRVMERLSPGASAVLDASLVKDFWPQTAVVGAQASSRPPLDVAGLWADLDAYPYGCLEQTASRALPLLQGDLLAERWSLELDVEVARRATLQRAVDRVLGMQRYGGGFGLWGPDDYGSLWLSAFATDFLTRAKAAGYGVSAGAYDSALQYLQDGVNGSDYEPESLDGVAYALYALAQADKARIGDLRYVHDNHLDSMRGALAPALLGAALSRHGDQARATAAFGAALAADSSPGDGYGSRLRDMAAVVALLGEAGVKDETLPALVEELTTLAASRRYLSTQEQGWLLRAAAALDAGGDAQVTVAGQAMQGDPVQVRRSAAELGTGVRIANSGQSPLWLVTTWRGSPKQADNGIAEGLRVTRRYLDDAGNPVDLTALAQNDVVTAVITVEVMDEAARQLLVVDRLPAGLELENAAIGGLGEDDAPEWLPAQRDTRYRELRDDRYIAAVDVYERETFHLVYRLRAVTPGTFTVPAVFVEDMYQPWLHARDRQDALVIE